MSELVEDCLLSSPDRIEWDEGELTSSTLSTGQKVVDYTKKSLPRKNEKKSYMICYCNSSKNLSMRFQGTQSGSIFRMKYPIPFHHSKGSLFMIL